MNRHWTQRRVSKGLLGAPLLLIVVTAQAQDFLTPEFRSFGPGKLTSDHRFNDFGDSGSAYNEDQKPWRFSSGMRISHFVSMELGYQNFGSHAEGDSSYGAAGWSLSGMLSLPLTSGLSPYARFGQVFWDGDRSSNLPSSNSESSRDLHYGVGLRFGLAEQLKLQFEYERFELEQTGIDIGSMNLQLSF